MAEPTKPEIVQEWSALRQSMMDTVSQYRTAMQGLPAFAKTDYQRLADLAGQTEQRLEKAGVGSERRQRLASLRALMLKMAAPEVAGEPPPQRPSETEVYLASSEIGDLSYIVRELTTQPGVWNQLLEQVLRPPQEDPAGVGRARLVARFAATCRVGKLKARPGPGDGGHDVEIDLDGWRMGGAIGSAKKPEKSSVIDACAEAQERLRAGQCPGVLVIDVTAPAWPERRLIAAPSDATAIAEINARIDRQIITSEPELVGATDRDLVFGIVATATIPTVTKPNKHVAFSTGMRIMALCGETDPRRKRLEAFAGRLSGQ